MKTLLIMRHAKSSWNEPGLNDHDRPLNSRGRNDAPRMSEWLIQQSLTPDLVAHSSAQRASETAQLMLPQWSESIVVQQVDEFYLAPPAAYLNFASRLQDDVSIALVIGHNPGMEDLVSHLGQADYQMPTAAVSLVNLTIDSWNEIEVATVADKVDGASFVVWCPKDLPT